MNDSIKLAQLWSNLKTIKDTLDNEILPVGGYLGIEDVKLVTALEELSERIEKHFDRCRLILVKADEE